MTYLAWWQAATQVAAERGFLASVLAVGGFFLTVMGLLYRAFSGWAKNVTDGVTNLAHRIDTLYDDMRKGLDAHEADDNQRFLAVEKDAHRRHEETMTAITKHANAMQAAVSNIDLGLQKATGERENIRDRVTALETRAPERRNKPR